MTLETVKKLDLIKKAVKANMHLVKDLSLPLCGGTSEASKEAPTCIFIQKAVGMRVEKDDIISYLKMDEDVYEKCRSKYIIISDNWKYKQKEQLVTNYLKYHG